MNNLILQASAFYPTILPDYTASQAKRWYYELLN